jgi:UrcA family protein
MVFHPSLLIVWEGLKMIFKKTIGFACRFAGVAVIASLASTPALAGLQVMQMTVHYDDLNLTRPAGARVLFDRLWHAARQVCGPRPAMADLDNYRMFESCVQTSVSEAVASAHQPMLTQVYRGAPVAVAAQLAGSPP